MIQSNPGKGRYVGAIGIIACKCKVPALLSGKAKMMCFKKERMYSADNSGSHGRNIQPEPVRNDIFHVFLTF